LAKKDEKRWNEAFIVGAVARSLPEAVTCIDDAKRHEKKTPRRSSVLYTL